MYLVDSLGVSGANLVLPEVLSVILFALDKPWLLAGDWNCSPGELGASGWPRVVRGAVLGCGRATSVAGVGGEC